MNLFNYIIIIIIIFLSIINIIMIGKWLKYQKNIDNLKLGLLVIFTSFAGGYMVSDFPKEFLNIFKHPIGQFFVFICINTMSYSFDESYTMETMNWIIVESIISVIILQLIKYILYKIYGSSNEIGK